MAVTRKKKSAPRTAVAKSVISKARKGLLAPSWAGCAEWKGDVYHKHVREARRFYYTSVKSSELISGIFAWMKEEGYTRDEIRAAKAAPAYMLGTNIGILCRLLMDGMMDFHQEEANYWEGLPGTSGDMLPVTDHIKPAIKNAIREGNIVLKNMAPVVEETEPVNVVAPPTIQERIMEQACEAAQDVDSWLETGAKGTFNFKAHFAATGVTQAHARKLIAQYEPQLVELREVASMPTPTKLKKLDEYAQDQWEQLSEGYSHMSKKDLKHMIQAYETVIGALNLVIDAAKANRKPRKTKIKPASKLVERIKYMKQDDTLQITSVNPEQIIGAKEVWVYNAQYRKFGKYVAADETGLSVKGTSIINYDETKSLCKTLRKPAEQLKEFKAAGKVKLRTFFEDIKTTEVKLNGRSNDKTLFLKVT